MNRSPEIATEKKLTPAQHKGIEALLSSGNVTAAATNAGVHRSTLYKWMADQVFADALREAEAAAVAALSRALAGLGEDAVLVLRDGMASSQKITVRLRAAEIVIGNLLRLRELVEIEARVADLESQYAKSL